MKRLLKKILPASLIKLVRYVRHYIRLQKAKIKIMLGMPLKEKLNKIRLEINIAEHCNLNCCGCSNFSPLAEPELVNVGEFERDFARLSNIFSHECERIYLIGGEPLLHPEINTLMSIARKYFVSGDIFVFTNGILLSKKKADFWETCRNNNIGILISAYPIKIDIDAIRAQANKFSVSVKWAWGLGKNTFSVEGVNLKGDSNIKLNFALCGRANNCITLSHGRLFTCTFAPHVRHFNKYFNQNVKIIETDYVNIYDDVSADEILRKMSEPIPACRYCRKVKPVQTVKWGISKREMSEWA